MARFTNPAEPGSISTGTLRTEDLIDTFTFELEALVQNNADAWCSDAGRIERDGYLSLVWDARECNPDDADDYVGDLFEALNEFAPDGHSFGAHEGDGSDFGFWAYDEE